MRKTTRCLIPTGVSRFATFQHGRSVQIFCSARGQAQARTRKVLLALSVFALIIINILI